MTTRTPAPLLFTKPCVPPCRPGIVARSRLLEELDRGARGKLTLISAPAGFGKTTLVAEWAAGLERPVVGLALWLLVMGVKSTGGGTARLAEMRGTAR